MEVRSATEEAMMAIAGAPASHFKTMIRFLSGGFRLDQAARLFILRSKIPRAVLTTDDYNMCVVPLGHSDSASLTGSAVSMQYSPPLCLRKRGVGDSQTDYKLET
jgi:hypothetical protein